MSGHWNRLLVWVPLLVFAALVGVQLFGPVPIGLADNNDFERVLGPLRIWPAAPFRNPDVLFRYFVDDYVISDPRWSPGIPTSELLVAKLAKFAARYILPKGTFRLRLMGILHGAMLLLALYVALRALRRRQWWLRAAFGGLLVLVWADLEYAQQLSTAYTDAGAVVAFAVVFAIALHAVLSPGGGAWPWAVTFAAFGCFLLGTKSQHDTALPLLVLFCLWMGYRQGPRLPRAVWLAAPLLLIGTVVYMLKQTPETYRAGPAFTVVFYKLAMLAPDSKAVLADFHMPEQEFGQYRGHYANEGSMPHGNPQFWQRILRLVTPATLAAFYWHHPALLAKALLEDLRCSATNITLDDYGHLRRADIEHGRYAFEVRVWSRFRKRLLVIAPLHLVYLFALVLALSVICGLQPRIGGWFPIWPVTLGTAMVAILSFLFASLADGVETARHLVFFHAATDCTILCLVLTILLAVERAAARP